MVAMVWRGTLNISAREGRRRGSGHFIDARHQHRLMRGDYGFAADRAIFRCSRDVDDEDSNCGCRHRSPAWSVSCGSRNWTSTPTTIRAGFAAWHFAKRRGFRRDRAELSPCSGRIRRSIPRDGRAPAMRRWKISIIAAWAIGLYEAREANSRGGACVVNFWAFVRFFSPRLHGVGVKMVRGTW